MNKTIYPIDVIKKSVDFVSTKINNIFQNEEIVMICVLNGGFMFFSDLVRKINNPNLYLDFIKAQSYDNNKQTENIKLSIDLKIDINNKTVILVDDILDTGKTIKSIVDKINKNYKPKDIYVCPFLTLKTFNNTENFKLINNIIHPENSFVAGYGLDNLEKDRHLEYVYLV